MLPQNSGGSSGSNGAGAASGQGDPTPEMTGPLGAGDHTVSAGDCVHSIAARYGHFWETVWNDPGNTDLKSRRDRGEALLPGDKVVIPPMDTSTESIATEQTHTFRRKGIPLEVHVRILKNPLDQRSVALDPAKNPPWEYDDTPVVTGEEAETEAEANQPYKAEVDGELSTGTTDGEGFIKLKVSAFARFARVTLRPGTNDERIVGLDIGSLAPATEPLGASQRLRNLGYVWDVQSEFSLTLARALERFQADRGLAKTGMLDSATCGALIDEHGS